MVSGTAVVLRSKGETRRPRQDVETDPKSRCIGSSCGGAKDELAGGLPCSLRILKRNIRKSLYGHGSVNWFEALPVQVMCSAASETCFEIFGLDILFDHKCKAKILEVNTCPSLGCSRSCAVDQAIKYPMLAELLHLVGPMPSCQVCIAITLSNSCKAMTTQHA